MRAERIRGPQRHRRVDADSDGPRRTRRRRRRAAVGSPPPTITGLPRSSGRSRCSTAAKNASRSTWRIVGAVTRLSSPHDDRRDGSRARRRSGATGRRRRSTVRPDHRDRSARIGQRRLADRQVPDPGRPVRPRLVRLRAHRPRPAGEPRLLRPAGRRVPPRPTRTDRGAVLPERARPGRQRPVLRRLPADAGDPAPPRSSSSSGPDFEQAWASILLGAANVVLMSWLIERDGRRRAGSGSSCRSSSRSARSCWYSAAGRLVVALRPCRRDVLHAAGDPGLPARRAGPASSGCFFAAAVLARLPLALAAPFFIAYLRRSDDPRGDRRSDGLRRAGRRPTAVLEDPRRPPRRSPSSAGRWRCGPLFPLVGI